MTNPHRSMLGLGNYDVNVLMAALATKGCAVVWHDRRRAVQCLDLDHVLGFVLNTPTQPTIGGLIPIPFVRRKHWVRAADDVAPSRWRCAISAARGTTSTARWPSRR